MKPEQQRIEIAEACGLRKCNCADWGMMDHLSHCPASWQQNENLPDYLADLNAMHEAEKILTPDQRLSVAVRLTQIIDIEDHDGEPIKNEFCRTCIESACFATAEQRAEAFLKTLNLWTE